MFTVFPSSLVQAFMGRCVLGMELIRSQPINNLWTINKFLLVSTAHANGRVALYPTWPGGCVRGSCWGYEE